MEKICLCTFICLSLRQTNSKKEADRTLEHVWKDETRHTDIST